MEDSDDIVIIDSVETVKTTMKNQIQILNDNINNLNSTQLNINDNIIRLNQYIKKPK